MERSRPTLARLVEAMLVVLTFATCSVVPLMRHPPIDVLEWAIVLALAGVSILGFFVAIWHFAGRERVVIGDGRLRAIRQLGPFRREWSVPLNDIHAVVVPALGRELWTQSWGIGRPSILVRAGARSLGCCVAVSPLEAEAIAERIRRMAQR
jgi:hypothetical protein